MSSGISIGGGSGGPPSIIFRRPGQFVDVAVCAVDVRPWIDYATNKVKVTDDGKERTQDVVKALCLRGDAVVRSGEDDVPLPVGEVVSIWIAGHRRWDFVQEQKRLGGMQVGDVMRVTYKGEEQGKGASPKRVWTFQIRHAKSPDEDEQTRRCVEIHKGAPIGIGASYGDEEPF